jgi:hypothetical protein
MRATFITTGLENGAQLELYDRRGYNLEKAAKLVRDVLNLDMSEQGP